MYARNTISINHSTVTDQSHSTAPPADACMSAAPLVCPLLRYIHCPLTIQDQPVWCLSGEELQRARSLASPLLHCQVYVTSPPVAMTTGAAAGCLSNASGHDAGQLPACRLWMWKTHWGSSLEALCCPGKRKEGRRKHMELKTFYIYSKSLIQWEIEEETTDRKKNSVSLSSLLTRCPVRGATGPVLAEDGATCTPTVGKLSSCSLVIYC